MSSLKPRMASMEKTGVRRFNDSDDDSDDDGDNDGDSFIFEHGLDG